MKDYISETKDILNRQKNEKIFLTSKASASGAATGLLIGLMVGYWKDKDLYVSGLVGGLLGAGISLFIVKNT